MPTIYPGARQFLYAPGALSDGGPYVVREVEGRLLVDDGGDGVVPPGAAAAVEPRVDDLLEVTGLTAGDIDTVLVFQSAVAVNSSTDHDAVPDALREAGFEKYRDDLDGHRFYRESPDGRAVAFSDHVLVGAVPTESGPAPHVVVETAVDTVLGSVDSYQEANDAFSELSISILGEAMVMAGRERSDRTDVREGRFRGERARGLAVRGEEDVLSGTVALEFAAGSQPDDLDAIRRWTRTDAFAGWSDVEVYANQGPVKIEGTIAPGVFRYELPTGGLVDGHLDWLPAAGPFGDGAAVDVLRTLPRELVASQGLPTSFVEDAADPEVRSLLDATERPMERLWAGPLSVVRTDEGAATIAEALRDGGFRAAGGHRGLSVFASPAGDRAAVVAGGTAVVARETEAAGAERLATASVDAALAEGPRLRDRDPDLALVDGALAGRPYVAYDLAPAEFGGEARALGVEAAPRGDRVDVTAAVAYATAGGAADADPRERFPGLEEVEVRRDGRLVVVSGRATLDDVPA